MIEVYQKHNKKELQEFFNRCPWEWMLTGEGEWDVSLDVLDRWFGSWRSETAKKTRCQVASLGVLTRNPQPHFHVLLAGRNTKGKNLSAVNAEVIQYLQGVWHKMSLRSAKIKPVYDEGAGDYVVENLLYDPTVQILTPHNLSLINHLAQEKSKVAKGVA